MKFNLKVLTLHTEQLRLLYCWGLTSTTFTPWALDEEVDEVQQRQVSVLFVRFDPLVYYRLQWQTKKEIPQSQRRLCLCHRIMFLTNKHKYKLYAIVAQVWHFDGQIIKTNYEPHGPTCMALLPSLTTSNRVTGSPPSPLCWATPLAFPRPLVTPTVLSVGDFRGFLLDACVDQGVNGAHKWFPQWCQDTHISFEALTGSCFPGLPLFFFPFTSGSSISLMLILKPTASVAPDSLDESLRGNTSDLGALSLSQTDFRKESVRFKNNNKVYAKTCPSQCSRGYVMCSLTVGQGAPRWSYWLGGKMLTCVSVLVCFFRTECVLWLKREKEESSSVRGWFRGAGMRGSRRDLLAVNSLQLLEKK